MPDQGLDQLGLAVALDAGDGEDLAAALVPRGRGYDFNQALMDLGATVCVARKPACGKCNLESLCYAKDKVLA